MVLILEDAEGEWWWSKIVIYKCEDWRIGLALVETG